MAQSPRRQGDHVVFMECDAMEQRCRAKLGKWGSNLCKLSGPAIREASHCVNAHDEALSRTLLVSGGLGAVLAFRPRHTMSCITHYVERKKRSGAVGVHTSKGT